MAIPSEKDIEKPLLSELVVIGGEARPRDLYYKVAKHFPNLTSSDLKLKHPKTGILIWKNRVQWARQHLVNKGEIDASVYGIWKITQRGRARIGITEKNLPISKQHLTTIGEMLNVERQKVRTQLHEILMSMHPQQFEEFAAKLLESVGFTDIEVTKYVGDGGIDGYGNFEMGVVKVKAAFQVKRWRSNVPRSDVDRFRGVIQGEFDQGIFITTSDYANDAKQISSKKGAVPVILINGDRILNIMLEKGLGVKQEPLAITKIDEEYFTAFGSDEE